MKNLYPGFCATCRAQVAVGAGDYNTATRKVQCSACAGVRPDAPPKVKGTRTASGKVSFAPTSFLGGDLFQKYREACRGAKFEPESRTQVCAFDLALAIVKNLQGAGFVVDLDPDVAASLQAKGAEIREHVADAGGRATEADQKLRSRGLTLFPFQKKGILWLAARTGALLADEMGLGKTIQAIVALPDDAPVLIVAPAVAKGVWARELALWRPEFSIDVISGRGNFRWPEAGEIIILNYDILPEDCRIEKTDSGCIRTTQTTNCAPRTVLIGDEAHALKSSKTKKTKAFRAISDAVQARNGKIWLITATPLLNRPPELWNILQAANIAREAFGSWNAFVKDFGGDPGEFGGYVWGTPTVDVEAKLRRVQLRRMREEVLPELPVKMWQTIDVEIDKASIKQLDKAAKFIAGLIPTSWERLISDDDPFEGTGKPKVKLSVGDIENARETLAHSSGTNFEAIARARSLLAQAKIPALIEVVEDFEEQEEPIVVFSAHRAPIDLLGTRPGWAAITGDTSPEKRTEIENAFQQGKLKGIAATIKAGGVAITLTRAHHAIFVDLEWTPALNAQAEDRLCRIGQTRGVIIIRLVARHALDKMLFEVLVEKTIIIDGSVNAAAVTGDNDPGNDGGPVIPEIDFAALEAAAELERQAASAAQRLANERHQAADNVRLELERELALARAEKRVIRADLLGAGCRGPQNAIEQWAFMGLITLALHDSDRASCRNQVGFNGADGPMGHRLANRAYEGLTDAEWVLAQAVCQKYWRQIGHAPG
jgi:hypothetical protein